MSRSSDILTTHQVAEKLGVNPVTVARWVKAGKLSAFKTAGGHRRIRREDLEEFLKKCGYYEGAAEEPAPAKPAPSGLKIMVVDDEEDIVTLIERTINDLGKGHQVHTASDGFMAGWLLRESKPDVVFLDLKMDGLDGFEVCRRIKSDTSFSDTHIIAVTGFATAENREKIIACGAAECLAKPIGPKDIREALERATAKVRS